MISERIQPQPDALSAFFCTEQGSTVPGYVIKWRYQ